MGDGLATALASLFGAPANTTYGENTGVLNLTKVFDPRVIRIAACLAILFSFCPKFAAIVAVMPVATIGGVSLVLYGMISAVGVRNLVENKVDLTVNLGGSTRHPSWREEMPEEAAALKGGSISKVKE